VHPRQRKKSYFKEIFAGWGELEGGSGQFSSFSLCAEVLRTMTKKKVVNFSRKKVHLPEKILATPTDRMSSELSIPECAYYVLFAPICWL